MTQFSRVWDAKPLVVGDAKAYSHTDWHSLYNTFFASDLDTNKDAIGYFPNYTGSLGTPFEVLESSPTSMVVRVNAGKFMLFGILFEVDSTETFTISDNTSGSTRIDSIVIKADWAARTVRYAKVEGVAGSGVPPTLTQTKLDVYEYKLADIVVVNNATTITNSNITNYAKPLQPITNNYKTIVNTTLPTAANFNALWENNEALRDSLRLVQTTNNKNLFISRDGGTNYFQIPKWVHLTPYTATGTIINTGSLTTVGTDQTFTADKEMVFVSCGANISHLQQSSASGSIGVQVNVTIGSTTYTSYNYHTFGQSAAFTLDRSVFSMVSSWFPCSIGNTVTINVKVQNSASVNNATWRILTNAMY